MKRSVLRISACALLLSSISSVYALTPRKRADIQDLIKSINSGSISGSGIVDAIKKLNITNKDDLNDGLINRIDRSNPKNGGLNQVAYNALKSQGYDVTSTFVVQDVMSGDESKLPTIESRSTLVRVPLRTVLKGHDLGPVIIEDANVLTAKSMLNTPIEKQQALDKLNLIIIDNISNLPANDQTALTTFKNDLEKNKYNTLSVLIPTTQVTLSPQVKAKIEAALSTPTIEEIKDEPTTSLPEQIKNFGKSVSDAAAKQIITGETGSDLGKKMEELQAQFEAKKTELASMPAATKQEILNAANKAGEEIAKVEQQAKAQNSPTKASFLSNTKNALWDMIKWNFGVEPIFEKTTTTTKPEDKPISITPKPTIPAVTVQPPIPAATEVKTPIVQPKDAGSNADLKYLLDLIDECKDNRFFALGRNSQTKRETGKPIQKSSDINGIFLDIVNSYEQGNKKNYTKEELASVLPKYLELQYKALEKMLSQTIQYNKQKLQEFFTFQMANAVSTTYLNFSKKSLTGMLDEINKTKTKIKSILGVTPALDKNLLSTIENHLNRILGDIFDKNTMIRYASNGDIINAINNTNSALEDDNFVKNMTESLSLYAQTQDTPLNLNSLKDYFALYCYTFDMYYRTLVVLANEASARNDNPEQKQTWLANSANAYWNTTNSDLYITQRLNNIASFLFASEKLRTALGAFFGNSVDQSNITKPVLELFNNGKLDISTILKGLNDDRIDLKIYTLINFAQKIDVSELHKKAYIELINNDKFMVLNNTDIPSIQKPKVAAKPSTGVSLQPLTKPAGEKALEHALKQLLTNINQLKIEVRATDLSLDAKKALVQRAREFDNDYKGVLEEAKKSKYKYTETENSLADAIGEETTANWFMSLLEQDKKNYGWKIW